MLLLLGWLLLKKLVVLLTLNKSKKMLVVLLALNKSTVKLTTKLPWEKLDAYAFFFFFFCPSLHVTSTPPQLPRPVRVSTSSELYPDTRGVFFVFFLNA